MNYKEQMNIGDFIGTIYTTASKGREFISIQTRVNESIKEFAHSKASDENCMKLTARLQYLQQELEDNRSQDPEFSQIQKELDFGIKSRIAMLTGKIGIVPTFASEQRLQNEVSKVLERMLELYIDHGNSNEFRFSIEKHLNTLRYLSERLQQLNRDYDTQMYLSAIERGMGEGWEKVFQEYIDRCDREEVEHFKPKDEQPEYEPGSNPITDYLLSSSHSLNNCFEVIMWQCHDLQEYINENFTKDEQVQRDAFEIARKVFEWRHRRHSNNNYNNIKP